MGSEKNKPVKFKLRVDVQCGLCGSLTHIPEPQPPAEAKDSKGAKESPRPTYLFPKFCPCCGAGVERFCLKCHRKADMYFEEWWPEDDECLRTYSPAKRCSRCNAILEPEGNNQDRGEAA